MAEVLDGILQTICLEKLPRLQWGQNGTATDPEGKMVSPGIIYILNKIL